MVRPSFTHCTPTTYMGMLSSLFLFSLHLTCTSTTPHSSSHLSLPSPLLILPAFIHRLLPTFSYIFPSHSFPALKITFPSFFAHPCLRKSCLARGQRTPLLLFSLLLSLKEVFGERWKGGGQPALQVVLPRFPYLR